VRERGDLKLEFTLVTNDDDPVRVQLIQAISDQLAQVGIHAIPQTVSWEDLVSQMLRLRRFDAVLSGWANLSPDPDPYPTGTLARPTRTALTWPTISIRKPIASWRGPPARPTIATSAFELYRQFQELFRL
jgi:ABC-type transport system substrate-binding protein